MEESTWSNCIFHPAEQWNHRWFAATILSLFPHQSRLIINYSTACCYIAQLDQQGARPRRLYDA